ncbi:MAG: hypothetical protein JXA89_23945 [Anaerolineae bacterium]|nr:hypothetical protein [Anaerolineae bacterium]
MMSLRYAVHHEVITERCPSSDGIVWTFRSGAEIARIARAVAVHDA